MQYTIDVTFPKGKSRASQTKSTLKLAKGIIHKIDIAFPSGCVGLVNVQIFLGGHPIAPSTQGQVYKGDDEVIIIPEFEELSSVLNLISIKGWNEDTLYDHTVLFRLYVLPKSVLLPIGAQEGIIASLRSLFVRR